MKKQIVLLGLALACTGAFAQTPTSGIDRSNLDTSVRPGDDFYHYAAGGWLKSHPLDAEHPENGAFVDLEELNQKRIQELILQYANQPQKQGTLGQKIGSLYNLMMDSVRLNREGWAPLKPTLDRIAAIKNTREYQIVTAALDRNGEGTMMYGIGVDADQRNAAWNLVAIGQGGLGLGTRDYYTSDDPDKKKVLEAYKTYLTHLFQLVGNDEATLRDVDGNYHKMSYTELVDQFPGIDWGNVMLASGMPAIDSINVAQPEPIHEVEKILANTPLEDLKTYAEAKVIMPRPRSSVVLPVSSAMLSARRPSSSALR